MKQERFKIIPAVHLFFIKDDKILLLRRFNTGYEDGNWSVPAGHLDGNEEVVKTTVREADEEVGVNILAENIKVVGIMHRMSESERVDFFVVPTTWQGEITNNEPQKCDALEWFELKTLPQNIIPYIKKAIYNYKNKIYFDSFGWQN